MSKINCRKNKNHGQKLHSSRDKIYATKYIVYYYTYRNELHYDFFTHIMRRYIRLRNNYLLITIIYYSQPVLSEINKEYIDLPVLY